MSSQHPTLRRRRLVRRVRLLRSRYCTAPLAGIHPPQREPRSPTPCTACPRFPRGSAGRSILVPSHATRHAPRATRHPPYAVCHVHATRLTLIASVCRASVSSWDPTLLRWRRGVLQSRYFIACSPAYTHRNASTAVPPCTVFALAFLVFGLSVCNMPIAGAPRSCAALNTTLGRRREASLQRRCLHFLWRRRYDIAPCCTAVEQLIECHPIVVRRARRLPYCGRLLCRSTWKTTWSYAVPPFTETVCS